MFVFQSLYVFFFFNAEMTQLKKISKCHGSVLSSGQSNIVNLYEERRGRDRNRKEIYFLFLDTTIC